MKMKNCFSFKTVRPTNHSRNYANDSRMHLAKRFHRKYFVFDWLKTVSLISVRCASEPIWSGLFREAQRLMQLSTSRNFISPKPKSFHVIVMIINDTTSDSSIIQVNSMRAITKNSPETRKQHLSMKVWALKWRREKCDFGYARARINRRWCPT